MKNMISNRINKIEESGIRKVFAMAAKAGNDVVNLSIGQPHFPTAQILKSSLAKATQNNMNAYTPTLGISVLREKICEKLKNKNGIDAGFEEVMVTSGVAGGIFLSLSAIINPGDEVILPDPYFVLYKQILNYLGAKIVYLDTYPDFQIDSKKLEKLVTNKTKLIIINSPNNPTGVVYDKFQLEKVAKIARKNDIIVLSDEIYEIFDYEKKFFSIGSIYEKTITLNGFSKSHSVTGWRIAYVHAPIKIIEAMNKLQQYSFVCAPAPVQMAIAECFEIDLSKEVANYKKNRDLIYESLQNNFELIKSDGAFYAFIKAPTKDFFDKLIKNKILAVPGNVFSEKNDYFRISFAVDNEILKQGINILKLLCQKIKKKK